MPFFRTPDGCSLYYCEFGDAMSEKPVLVLLNGTAQTTVNWLPHIKKFREKFRVLAYDGRSQGKSDPGDLPLSPERHVGDLMALLDALKIRSAALVGMSHGAGIALCAALAAPERTDRLVLCSAGALPDFGMKIRLRSWVEILRAGGAAAMAWAFLPTVFGDRFLQENEKVLDKMVSAIVRRNKPDALSAHLSAMSAYPSLSHIARQLRIPTLIISGGQDPLVSFESAAELARLCGGIHRHFPDAGHSVPAEVPALFHQMVMAFLMGS
ncbi:alpha/beta hydrolase [Desulfonema ishimotonii]|uniref:Alpha/beta hydrolase n=1 Tax=Desulfonema ishimotonii TaxID=45657 RepID=A0A401G2A1_9BACT|nr:alpha/beta hydrolase [Desulfonema ishimotonii]GBC63368.1 alpha/beta hydrolase [Desulfonema ishimotonii]